MNAATAAPPLLEVADLRMHFPIRRGLLGGTVGLLKAVDGVGFAIQQGETLGLVGESGCGKTTLGRCILRAYTPTSGEILYRREDGERVDLARLGRRALRPYRRQLAMIFQDPYSSLNPRMTVRELIGEPLRVNRVASGKEIDERVGALLRRVGLRPEYLRRYPHAFSGGERQRIGIARALALRPRLVVADEAVSALDVSIRAQILNLLDEVKADLGLTYLFVAHDLSVVEHACDRVAVMYLGKIVELAETETLFLAPRMPYTEALLSAVPRPNPRLRDQGRRIVLTGEIPSPVDPPAGCAFHTRCPYAQARCREEAPALRQVAPGHLAACHFAEQLDLRGVADEGAVAAKT